MKSCGKYLSRSLQILAFAEQLYNYLRRATAFSWRFVAELEVGCVRQMKTIVAASDEDAGKYALLRDQRGRSEEMGKWKFSIGEWHSCGHIFLHSTVDLCSAVTDGSSVRGCRETSRGIPIYKHQKGNVCMNRVYCTVVPRLLWISWPCSALQQIILPVFVLAEQPFILVRTAGPLQYKQVYMNDELSMVQENTLVMHPYLIKLNVRGFNY